MERGCRRQPLRRFVAATRRNHDAVVLAGDPQIDELLELLHACHRILPRLDDEDNLAQVLREVCEAVEARLRELNGPHPEVTATEAD